MSKILKWAMNHSSRFGNPVIPVRLVLKNSSTSSPPLCVDSGVPTRLWVRIENRVPGLFSPLRSRAMVDHWLDLFMPTEPAISGNSKASTILGSLKPDVELQEWDPGGKKLSTTECTGANWNEGITDGRGVDEIADPATLASLLRRYGKVKALSEGRLMHSCISRLGYDINTFLGNCIIEMYGNSGSIDDTRAVFCHLPNPNLFSWNLLIKSYVQNGCLDDARSVFNQMPSRDVVSWNAMIAAYVQNDFSKEALDLFRLMKIENVKPDSISVGCALNACASLQLLSVGKEIHAAIAGSDCAENLAVGKALVNMYGKCGSVCNARRIFSTFSCHDVGFWTAMLSAFAENGYEVEALVVFQSMQLGAIELDKVALVCALDVCARLVAFIEGQKVHVMIGESGCGDDVVVATALIHMYSKCGSVNRASSVFDKMPCRDVVSWETMIAALLQNGHMKDALDLFCRMQLEGFKPEHNTFLYALSACASIGALKEGQEIHAAIIISGSGLDLAIENALVNMYGKCGHVCHAKTVFYRMPYRDTVSWNAMIAAFAQNGHGNSALSFFNQMLSEGFNPDIVTIVCVLSACSSLASLQKTQEMHSAISENVWLENSAAGNALINCYYNCESICDARKVFSAMINRDVISWTNMIAAYAQKGNSKEALDLFCKMQLEGIKPNSLTFVSALDACASLAAFEEGQRIHAGIVESVYCKDLFVETGLLNMYGRCGSVDDAKAVFNSIPHLSIVSWTAMILAFAQNGYSKETLDLFHRMQSDSVKPDNATFTCALYACSHTGLVDEGWHLFLSISANFGAIHTIDHYVCMIDLLGRAGHLDEAEELIYNLPVETAALALRCLLGACRIHDDEKRAERAANCFSELVPSNSAPFLILASIYSICQHSNNLEGVKGLRILCKESLGTCVEMNTMVHKIAV